VNGSTGLIVPSRDALALHDAIIRLATDPDECFRIAPLARARAETSFDQVTVRGHLVGYLETLARALTVKRMEET